MVDAFQAYWTQFAFFHDPNGPAGGNASAAPLQWPGFGRQAEESLQMDAPFSITERLDAEYCDGVWDPFVAGLSQASSSGS
jgi:hypothetical protein